MELRVTLVVFLSTLYICASPTASLNPGTPQRIISRNILQRAGLKNLILRKSASLTPILRGGDGQKVVPGVAWSQEAESLLLKVDMPPGMHSTDSLRISDTHITWKEGEVDLDMGFFAEIKSDSASIFCDGGRQIKITLAKKDKSWWPRLTNGPKPANVKVDWATWKDEDEAETAKYSGGIKQSDADFNYDDMPKDNASPWLGDDDKDDGAGDFDGKDDAGKGIQDPELEAALDKHGLGKGPEEIDLSGNAATTSATEMGDSHQAGVGLAISDIELDSSDSHHKNSSKPRVSVIFAVSTRDEIEIGDRFLEINGHDVKGETAKEVGSKLLGPLGSFVTVKLLKADLRTEYTVKLQRDFRYVSCRPETYRSTGIGLLLDANDLKIVGILEGSDGSKGGVVVSNSSSQDEWSVSRADGTFRVGDVIEAVDDITLAGKNQEDIVNLFSDPEGTIMRLALRRSSPPEKIVVAIRRGTVRGPCSAWNAVPVEEHVAASNFSGADKLVMSTLMARHTSCEFKLSIPPMAPKIEWDDFWHEENRDPFGESQIRELGESLRQRRQAEPSAALFIDPFFPHERESVITRYGGTSDRRPFYSVNDHVEPEIEWKRPNEILDPKDIPQVWCGNNISEDDVQQGRLSDCYLLAALSACAAGEKDVLLRDLCVEDYADVGLYGVKFFVMGRWITIFIDDCIPCVLGKEGFWEPLFAKPKERKDGYKVLWPMLFEKAFAKLHRSYESIAVGSVSDAFQYLTGGTIVEELLGILSYDDEWKMLKKAVDMFTPSGDRKAFVACGISSTGEGGTSEVTDEELRQVGLVRHHAYSVIKCLDEPSMQSWRRKPVRLVQIRNPWANSMEWQGKFSDKDAKSWQEHQLLAQEAKFKAQDDGSFWMEQSDFRKYFDYVQICKPSISPNHGPKSGAQGTAHGSKSASESRPVAPKRAVRVSGAAANWIAGKTAGGNAEYWESQKLSAVSGFEYNPRFQIISLGEPVQVTVYQPDTRHTSKVCWDSQTSQQSKTGEPMMDIFVYVRDDASSEWKLEMQLFGGPYGDRFRTCTLLDKKRCEVMVTAKEPGMQGPFSITAAGEGCLLTPCKLQDPPESVSKLLVTTLKHRWSYDPKLKSNRDKRQVGAAPLVAAALATGSSSQLLSILTTLTVFVAGSFYGNGGSSSADFLYSPQNLTLQTGQNLNFYHNYAGQIRNNSVVFSVAPSLPKGLSLDKASGRITGSTSAVRNGLWNVTVTNIPGGESASTSFGLVVLESPVKFESKLYSLKITQEVVIMPKVQFDAHGSRFTVNPALPEGLVLNDGGSISGIPLLISAPKSYEVTATNSYTQYVAGLRLEIVPDSDTDLMAKAKLDTLKKLIIEEMHYSYSTFDTEASNQNKIFTYFVGKRMVPDLKVTWPKVADSNSLGKFRFKCDSVFPPGLQLNRDDGTISGVPRTVTAAQNLNISLSHNGELWTLLKVPLQIIDTNRIGLKNKSVLIRRGESTIVPIHPQFDCSDIQNFSVVPALPSNLKFTASPVCGLSGSAAVVSDAKEHTAGIYWKSGFMSFKFTLEILEPLAQLEYNKPTGTYIVGMSISHIIPTYAFGLAAKDLFHFSVQPKLPRGILLEKFSGVISGTPRSATKPTLYTITVMNKAGDTKQYQLSIEVVDQGDIQATYSNSTMYLAINNSVILPLKVRQGLDWILARAIFDVFPPLPLGMMLGANGSIEGTPLVIKQAETFSVRITYPLAADSSGALGFAEAKALASISIVKQFQQLCYDSVDAYYVVGRRIQQNRPVFDASCYTITFSASPALPEGLKLDERTGIISGTPKITQHPSLFAVTGSNAIGDNVTVRIRIEIGSVKFRGTANKKVDSALQSCREKREEMNRPLDSDTTSFAMSVSFKTSRRYIF